MKKPPFVAARLRQRRDADIIEALEGIEPGDVSCLVREGLRRVLNIDKQPEPKLQHEVLSVKRQDSVPMPETDQPQKIVKQSVENKKPPQKPAVWNFPK